MTDPKNDTVWITIPDEAIPASEAPVKVIKRVPAEKVKNKIFWSVGFVILLTFISLLLAPQQFVSLLKGDLFDGSFQVIPDYQEQAGGSALFGDEEEEAGEESETVIPEDETVVEAESEAVSIQIEPISEVDGSETGVEDETVEAIETSEEGAMHGAGEESISNGVGTVVGSDVEVSEEAGDAEPVLIDAETGVVEPIEGVTEVVAEGAVTDTDLLQSLSKQLNDMKEKEVQNEQLIQDLMQMLQDQATGLHSSVIGTSDAAFLPQGAETTAQIGAGVGTGAMGAGVGTAGSSGVYRYNTHTVTVNPYDILSQNRAAMTQPVSYQANMVTYQPVQYSQQAYNPVLAGVQGQPGTGPAETILFAFALASLGVLVWGASRALRKA
ncbi:hypothetical protein JXD20_01390 [Candidatus Peregrinibacteria bacterium]|nr:hypothetical protein [Candidatus Peregrinibacteria bacterium]